MQELLFVVLLGGALYGGWCLGRSFSSRNIALEVVEGFVGNLGTAPTEKLRELVRERKPVSYRSLGVELAKVGVDEGIKTGQIMSAPPEDEVQLSMRPENLKDVAWMADTGFQIWIARKEQWARHGERLTKERAEKIAKALEIFERRSVPNFFKESEQDKEMRFTLAENRMKDIWDAYG